MQYKKPTEEQVKEARELRSSGLSYKVIGEKIGIPQSTIRVYIKDIVLSDEQKQALKDNGKVVLKQKFEERQQYLKEIDFKYQTRMVKGSYDPKGIGQKSEAQVLALFLKNDMVVLTPFGDNERYDLVVDEGKFVKVQCKTARYHGDYFTFQTCSLDREHKPHNYRGQVDVFAVYLAERDEIYIFNVNNVPLRTCTVRLINARQGNCRLAENNLFVAGKSLLEYS